MAGERKRPEISSQVGGAHLQGGRSAGAGSFNVTSGKGESAQKGNAS